MTAIYVINYVLFVINHVKICCHINCWKSSIVERDRCRWICQWFNKSRVIQFVFSSRMISLQFADGHRNGNQSMWFSCDSVCQTCTHCVYVVRSLFQRFNLMKLTHNIYLFCLIWANYGENRFTTNCTNVFVFHSTH